MTGVNFTDENVRQKFTRTVCLLFESQQGCSVQFQAQVKVELEFSDVATARAAKKSIETLDFETRLAAALNQKNPDDSVFDGVAFDKMNMVYISVKYAKKPQIRFIFLDEDNIDAKDNIDFPTGLLAASLITTASAVVVIIVLSALSTMYFVERNHSHPRTPKLSAASPKAVVMENEEYNQAYWGDENSSARPHHETVAHIKARTSLVVLDQPFGEISTSYL